MTLLLAARLEAGWGNPNVAGAFFAMVAVGAWALRSRWPVAFLLSGTATLLVAWTESRGAVVALGLGHLVAWLAAGRPRPNLPQVGCILLLVALFAGTNWMEGINRRMSVATPANPSISARLSIYQSIPAMVWAAPDGWGWGKSASAFSDWFQSPSDSRTYKHLLSTHATWMADGGWLFVVAYFTAWLVAFLICGRFSAAIGIWVVLAVTGIFNHVGQDGSLWILPVLSLIAAVVLRYRQKAWPTRREWIGVSLAGTICTTVLLLAGAWQSPSVRHRAGATFVHGKTPILFYFRPDPDVLGNSLGKTLRERSEPVAVISRWDQIPANGVLLLSGNIQPGDRPAGSYRVIWVNPPAILSEKGYDLLRKASKSDLIWGDMRTDANFTKLQRWAMEQPTVEWHMARGQGRLVQGIPAMVDNIVKSTPALPKDS